MLPSVPPKIDRVADGTEIEKLAEVVLSVQKWKEQGIAQLCSMLASVSTTPEELNGVTGTPDKSELICRA